MRAKAFVGPLLALCAPALAGNVAGRVELLEKGGKQAGDLSEVVVYLEGPKARPKPESVKVVMKGKAFIPHVLAVGAGTSVEFPNEDSIFHNAFSLSDPNRFDLELYKRPKTGSFTFRHPGVVKVYCNIHPQMSAVVVVLDNPFFARASREGDFAIEGVPAGRYQLRAWHERGGEAAVDVTVPAEGKVSAELRLDASSFKRIPHKNKFGKDYGPGEKY